MLSGGSVPRLIATAGTATAVAAIVTMLASDVMGWGDVKLAPTLGIVLADRHAVLDGVILVAALIVLTAVAVGDRRAGFKDLIVPRMRSGGTGITSPRKRQEAVICRELVSWGGCAS